MPDPMDLSDDDLDILIRTRLSLVGVDLEQLPEAPDPQTGSPTREQAYASLRAFLRTTVPAISGWSPPGDPRTAQQVAPPLLYPSIATAWAPGWEGGLR
ncbi:hypothetical protein [Kineococcus arenarius]|uniref:hypothetical protein n=1 Tax=Kineococcus sp. SYSU DK007 TaxID=3383128 RepID=UPI003D7D9EAF